MNAVIQSSRYRNTSFSIAPRSGFTIIEVLLSLTLASTLMAGTVALVSLAQTSSDNGQESLRIRQDIRRFADDLRRDIKLASEFQLNAGRLEISFAARDQIVHYEIQAESKVTREVVGRESSRNPPERYQLGRNASVSIKRLEHDRTVQITIIENGRDDHPVVIQAVGPIRNQEQS